MSSASTKVMSQTKHSVDEDGCDVFHARSTDDADSPRQQAILAREEARKRRVLLEALTIPRPDVSEAPVIHANGELTPYLRIALEEGFHPLVNLPAAGASSFLVDTGTSSSSSVSPQQVAVERPKFQDKTYSRVADRRQKSKRGRAIPPTEGEHFSHPPSASSTSGLPGRPGQGGTS